MKYVTSLALLLLPLFSLAQSNVILFDKPDESIKVAGHVYVVDKQGNLQLTPTTFPKEGYQKNTTSTEVHESQLMYTSQLSSDPIEAGVSNSDGELMNSVRVSRGQIDIRSLPQGAYNVSVSSGRDVYISTLEKDSGPIDCPELVTQDSCSVPSFEDNIVGTWSYYAGFVRGVVQINEDGTYIDVFNTIVSNGVIRTRTWFVEDGRLNFEVQRATFRPRWVSVSCDSIFFDGEGLVEDFYFVREAPCAFVEEASRRLVYPRLLEESERTFDLNNLSSSSFQHRVEFQNDYPSTLVGTYQIFAAYEFTNINTGLERTAFTEVAEIMTQDMVTNDLGFQETPMVEFSALELFELLQVDTSNVRSGDRFLFTTKLNLENGASFQIHNNPLKVATSDYGGFYNFSVDVTCPVDIAGTYRYETVEAWCTSDTLTGSVDLIEVSDDRFTFDDWSFGTYEACFGVDGPAGFIEFALECGEIRFVSLIDSFGDVWTIEENVAGNVWTLNWSNTSDESGTTRVFFNEGQDWPINE